MSWYKANAHFQRVYYKQHKLGCHLGTTKSVYTLIIQLIFLQQHFPILMPCNITSYCMAQVVLMNVCYCMAGRWGYVIS